jgi:hypothetical protein
VDNHEHDLMRMDDDGAPPPREHECGPRHIGIAPAVPTKAPVNSNDSAVEPPPAPMESPQILDSQGEAVTTLTWAEYLAWRKTKCRAFDPAVDGDTRRLEEIDQATHEVIGEIAELGELILANGPNAFYATREKLIDECGDILFCAMWAIDAWALRNPLADATDLELLRVTDEDEVAAFAQLLAQYPLQAVLANHQFVAALGNKVLHLMLQAQSFAGLTSNAFKKLRFQRRAQDPAKQLARIMQCLVAVNQILIIANSSVEEALRFNKRKLDARYPNGYLAGQGGGIRQGLGK